MSAAKKKVSKKKTSKKKLNKKKASSKKKKKDVSQRQLIKGQVGRKEKQKKKKKRVVAKNPPKGDSVGRPTYYGPELIELSRHYLENYWEVYDDPVPSIAGLACVLGIPRERIYLYAMDEDKIEFRNIYDEILATQEKGLLRGGLSNVFNPSITKLVLGKHGYHEKQDTAISGPNEGPIESITRKVVDPKDKS